MNSGIVKIAVPNFDTTESANPVRTVVGSLGNHPWILKAGNGIKKVWAEIEYTDPAGALRKDTVMDSIAIAPYRIRLAVRNPIGTSNATAQRVTIGRTSDYIVYKTSLDFSVWVYGDTTINTTFDYWLVFSDSADRIDPAISDTARTAWLETAAQNGNLTGLGLAHDDTHIYNYSIDTSVSNVNLATLRKTIQPPNPVETVAFSLRGKEPLNEYATAGSFWGSHPVRWDGTTLAYRECQTSITNTPQHNFRELTKLTCAAMAGTGKKECYLVARFTGKEFNDVRIAISNPVIFSGVGDTNRLWFDFYQPAMRVLDTNAGFINNGSNIQGVFSYNFLVPKGSVIDGGYAPVQSISLIIAIKPDSIHWISPSTIYDSTTATKITVEKLLSFRHEIFPYSIPKRSSSQDSVQWNDIGTSNWPAGQYIMGIVSTDEYGNTGFAPYRYRSFTNPWCVTINVP